MMAKWASQAHVKMRIVPPPGTYFVQPGTVLLLTAECLFNDRINENPFYFRSLGSNFEYIPEMG